MDPISTFNVEEVFKFVAPKHPRERLVEQVAKDFVLMAQSILYNVPESQERVDALKLLHEAEQICISRILEE